MIEMQKKYILAVKQQKMWMNILNLRNNRRQYATMHRKKNQQRMTWM